MTTPRIPPKHPLRGLTREDILAMNAAGAIDHATTKDALAMLRGTPKKRGFLQDLLSLFRRTQ